MATLEPLYIKDEESLNFFYDKTLKDLNKLIDSIPGEKLRAVSVVHRSLRDSLKLFIERENKPSLNYFLISEMIDDFLQKELEIKDIKVLKKTLKMMLKEWNKSDKSDNKHMLLVKNYTYTMNHICEGGPEEELIQYLHKYYENNFKIAFNVIQNMMVANEEESEKISELINKACSEEREKMKDFLIEKNKMVIDWDTVFNRS